MINSRGRTTILRDIIIILKTYQNTFKWYHFDLVGVAMTVKKCEK